MSSSLDATELLVFYVDTQNILPSVKDVVRSFDDKNSNVFDFCVDLQPNTSQAPHSA